MAFSGVSTRTKGLISTVLVAVLTAAVWYLQGGTGDGDDSAEDPASPAPSYSSTATTDDPEPAEMPATDDLSGLPYVPLADLPPEAAATVTLIDEGGPFPYDKDGSIFGNYEGLLPDREDGYYEEYTVETPGSDDRGARRIVGGADGELYWTEDHYESFEVIWR
ncbi:ribonuclease domain-containing protein [Nocardioides immobilis]|nr:ribonuclease domain-containing protein [Nocardioides immobilis]